MKNKLHVKESIWLVVLYLALYDLKVAGTVSVPVISIFVQNKHTHEWVILKYLWTNRGDLCDSCKEQRN